MPEEKIEKLKKIGDILMGAAYSDGQYVQEEAKVVREVLEEINKGPLSEEVNEHLEAFEFETFDLKQACSMLQVTSSPARRMLLTLIARVTEADGVLDFDESDYIVKVARCIGAPKAEYSDLTFELLEESDIDSLPPPIPPEAR